MKQLTYILTLLLLSNCTFNENNYCRQELALLNGNYEYTATFDFELSKEKQFDNLQSQIEKNICSGIFVVNGVFTLPNKNTLNIPIIIERYCDDNIDEDAPYACILVRTQRIFINNNSEILIENKSLKLDSLAKNIAEISTDFFIKNNFRPAAYELEWDNNVPVQLRKRVFAEIVKGYLIAAKQLAQKQFQKKICKLDDNEISWLKRNFQIMFSLKYM